MSIRNDTRSSPHGHGCAAAFPFEIIGQSTAKWRASASARCVPGEMRSASDFAASWLELFHPSFATSCAMSTSAWVLRIVNAGSKPASSKMIRSQRSSSAGRRRRVLDPLGPRSSAGPTSNGGRRRFNQMAFGLDAMSMKAQPAPSCLGSQNKWAPFGRKI